MKRDLDLIRHILLVIENSDKSKLYVEDFVTDIYDPKAISFHVTLLIDCGYIEATKFTTLRQKYQQYMITRITSFGYDYLDSIRNDNIWEKTKNVLASVGSSASLEFIKTIALKIIQNSIRF